MITISNKSYGISYERKERELLEAQGYLVIRSSASIKLFDIVGIRKEHLLLEQCKATKRKYFSFKKETKEISGFNNCPAGTICRLILYHHGKRRVLYEKVL